MSESTDLETTDEATALAELEQREAALAQAAPAEEADDFVFPRLKLTQQLTREVTDGDVSAGEFINSITGESYGDEVELVVVHRFKGRIYSDDDRTYVASGPIAPQSWPEEFRGRPFADIPQAEEQHKAQANAPGGEWGKGPSIQTTYNYVGFVPSEPDLPVRLTFKATAVSAAKKWNLLLRSGGSPSATVYKVSAERRENRAKQPYFVPTVKRERQASIEERQIAVRLAESVQANLDVVEGRFADSADDAAPSAAKPSTPEDSLDV